MPVPNPNALSSTFQVGTYTSLTDTFTSVFDLNDGVTTTIMWNTLRMPQPEKQFVRSFNLRAPGERVTRFQYKNRHIQVSVSLRGATVQTILNTCHSLIAAIENPPYRIRFSQPNATQYTYATVVAVTHNIPADPQTLLAKALTNVQIDFECQPGLLGDRVTLSNLATNPGIEAPSGPGVTVFNDSFSNVNAYTVVAGSAPTVAANVMSVAAGTTLSFGSPAWGAINTWQVRFKWVTGLTINFSLHGTGNNKLFAEISTNAWNINHTVGGTNHVLASAVPTTTNGNFYWAVLTQFPTQAGSPPYVQATLYNDSAGSIGTVVSALGPVATFDAVTALSGLSVLEVAGATAQIGGVAVNNPVQFVQLFGPGGWTFTNFGTSVASGAWEQNTANTFPNGPVTSYGALRITAPPTGGWNAQWLGGDASSTARVQQTAIPIAAAGNVLGLSAWLKSSGVAASCNQALLVNEYDSTGAFLRQSAQIGTLTGAQAAWTQISTNYTTGANCAYVIVICAALDATSASANGIVWYDNIQVYNQTTTGQTTMAWHDLRGPQSPYQLVVSGLAGDMPTPAMVATGTYLASLPPGSTISLLLGRRAQTNAAAALIRWPLQPYLASLSIVLDSGSYGGYYIKASAAAPISQGNLWQAPSAAAAVGTYHLIERAQTSQTVGNLGNISSQLAAYQAVLSGAGTQSNFFNAYIASQFAASATWTLVDHGALNVPIFGAGALSDLTQHIESAYGNWSDTTGGGSVFSFGVSWLLPIDADSLAATLINPSNGSGGYITFWLWAYSDALNQVLGGSFAWGLSAENTGLPAPAHSIGGPGTQRSGQLSVNPAATPYLTLDPTIGGGTNQLAGALTDANATLLPFHSEIQYIPLFLYPR